MASLTVVSGPCEGDYYPLPKKAVIGRDESVPIQVKGSMVSRRHIQIRSEAGSPADRYLLTDMNSANGTVINGRAIATQTEIVLEDNDIIEVGNSKIMFSLRDFPDKENALLHYKQRGERGKSTLIQ